MWKFLERVVQCPGFGKGNFDRFSCTVANIYFFSNGKTVKKLDRFKSVKKGSKRVLKITRVEQTDVEYSCSIDTSTVTTTTRVVWEGEIIFIFNGKKFISYSL